MYQQRVKTFIDVAKKYIRDRYLIVVEFEALNYKETLGFNGLLNKPTIFTFECNPNMLPLCRKRVKKFNNIHLIKKAVTNINGKVKFYSIDQKKTVTTWKDGNPRASSLYKASGKYSIERYVQKEIEVEAITLKSFFKERKIHKVDLLWMDIQGGELLILKGLGDKIRNVKFIYTKVEFFEIYKDQPLFEDIKSFLNKNGFMFLGFTNLGQYSGDAIFINKQIIKNKFKIFKIILWGDKDLLWNKYRPIFLLKTYNTISKVFWEIHSKVLIYLYRQSWVNKLIGFKRQFGIDVNIGLSKTTSSKMKIDVIIPVAMKDINILPYCINSIRKHVKHPINNIFIISSKTDDITTFCNTNSCTFIDEDTVLPIRKRDIRYNFGTKDRSGWLFQQLLKLSGDTISKLENYVFVDTDTVYIRDKVFENNNKIVFDVSDEYHKPYFKTYKKLLGCDGFLPVSLTSHNMLVNVLVLRELKYKIEKKSGLKWYQAIINNIDEKETSFISEQELYGIYMFQNYRDNMILEYWYNLSLRRTDLKNIEALKQKMSSKFKSISFHSYYV